MPSIQSNSIGQMEIRRSAHFPDIAIRRSLSRDWRQGPRALVLGCNPSNAGADAEDPTTRWWNRWFQHHGYGGYDACNLYPFVTSSPEDCRERTQAAIKDPAGRDHREMAENLTKIVTLARSADTVFACYGNIAWDPDWTGRVLTEILNARQPSPEIWCWGMTKNGSPTHPMARGRNRLDPYQPPILFRGCDQTSQVRCPA